MASKPFAGPEDDRFPRMTSVSRAEASAAPCARKSPVCVAERLATVLFGPFVSSGDR